MTTLHFRWQTLRWSWQKAKMTCLRGSGFWSLIQILKHLYSTSLPLVGTSSCLTCMYSIFVCSSNCMTASVWDFLMWAQMLMHTRAVWTPEESLHWKRTLGETSLAAFGSRTHVSIVPGILDWHSTTWAIPAPLCKDLRIQGFDLICLNAPGGFSTCLKRLGEYFCNPEGSGIQLNKTMIHCWRHIRFLLLGTHLNLSTPV